MRFTDATPSLSDAACGLFGGFVNNATVLGLKVLNDTRVSLDDLTGARVVDALTIALEPGEPVSVLVCVISLLLISKKLAVRKAALIALEAHSHLD
tara:strand:+ start:223 stop:510 length:288 start_codon:yes stop_codon:yes gene_type:complete